MSEKLCEVCDRERTPIGEPGCHRHASFPGQAGYLECYRLGCERLPAALAAAEERGRRARIEEADELRATLRLADAVLMEAELYRGTPPGLSKLCATVRLRIRVALAPRDSGKEGT